ncbi:MAG: Uma2 family endonuclease [Acidobacteriia bacterium]|nr:Uma2 family endonuclease [Terriglobia bacterium]
MATKTIPRWNEFLTAAKEGEKCEWVDAEVVLMTPVNFLHEIVLTNLAKSLGRYCDANPGWVWVLSNAVFTMSSGNWRCPDASLVRRSRLPADITSLTRVEFAPDVAFEILSPSDTPSRVQRKRQDYLGSCVIQVWIDPEKGLVELIEPDRPPRYVQGTQPLAITCLPGFELIPQDLFKI